MIDDSLKEVMKSAVEKVSLIMKDKIQEAKEELSNTSPEIRAKYSKLENLLSKKIGTTDELKTFVGELQKEITNIQNEEKTKTGV